MIKRICVVTMLVITLTMCSSVGIFAATRYKVTASSHKVYSKVITKTEASAHKYWTASYYKAGASGYVTVKKKSGDNWVGARHYTNVELLNFGVHELYSGRIWDTGKVSANTGYSTKSSGVVDDFYGSAIYYGW